ncbi:Protein MON2 homolog, partial [Geodia barretti]
LSGASLDHLISALCQLSLDEVSSSPNREPSLFAMTSLLETGVANLERIDLIWPPITSHFIEVCSSSEATLRGFAADSLSSLIRSALPLAKNQEMYIQLLSPLLSLQSVLHVDVRQRQLDCVSNVLHSSGQSLGSSWDVILNVIKSAASLSSEALVRSGFQSLQLVVADFLPHLPPPSLPTTLHVSTRYGLQTVDINISLSSVGLLWSIADHLYQNKETIRVGLEGLRRGTGSGTSQSGLTGFEKRVMSSPLPVFDVLWVDMFRGLSELCADERAAVRKSSAQTLFSTISAHGTLLHTHTWETVLGEVLFPLLEKVHTATREASTSSLQSSALLIHHTRDSAKKQWAETQVLTLSGTARLFQSRWDKLVSLPNFSKTWTTLLSTIKLCASSTSVEVSVAATNSFLSIVNTETIETKTETSQQQQQDNNGSGGGEGVVLVRPHPVSLPPKLKRHVWKQAWDTWNGIGTDCVARRLPALEGLHSILKTPLNMERVDRFFLSIPSQKFLVNLLKIFLHIHDHMKGDFTTKDFALLTGVLHAALPMPISKDVSPFLVPSASENVMSSLHELVLRCVGAVFSKTDVFDDPASGDGAPEVKSLLVKKPHVVDVHRVLPVATDKPRVSFYPLAVTELLKFSLLAAEPPIFIRNSRGAPPASLPFMGVNYAPFGLAAQALAVQLYRSCVLAGVSLPSEVPELFLKSLLPALKLKHSLSVAPQVWTRTVSSLLVVLQTSLPLLLQQGLLLSLSLLLYPLFPSSFSSSLLFPPSSFPLSLVVHSFIAAPFHKQR